MTVRNYGLCKKAKMMNFLKGGSNEQSSNHASAETSESNPENIPKDELMQLCMKMNKRMQAMETKGKELVKKKQSLLAERKKLVEILKTCAPIAVNVVDDNDLDVGSIDVQFETWLKQQKDRELELEQKAMKVEQSSNTIISSLETRHRKEINDLKLLMANSAAGSSSDGSNQDTSNKILEDLMKEKEEIQSTLDDFKVRCSKQVAEMEHLRNVESYYKDQLSTIEKVILEKNLNIEELQKQVDASKNVYEEKIVYMQMQNKNSNEAKDKEIATMKKQIEKMNAQLIALGTMNEEKEMSVKSNKDMIQALQSRLIELEPELAQTKEKLKDYERHGHANAMLKAEQEALLNQLRRDLKVAIDERDEAMKRVKELDEYKVKAEGQLIKLAPLTEQINVLQASIEDKTSLITRLRAEAQTSERNHAMRTAMLATCEAQLETLQKELATKDETVRISVDRVTSLQIDVSTLENRLAERVAESNTQITSLEQKIQQMTKSHEQTISLLKHQHEENIEAIKKDHAKKSSMARTLLSEKEEEVRVLTAKVQELQEEISSGAPSERKIFELAKVQANREATHGIHNDTRQIAFEQLQRSLSMKDMDLARAQQKLAEISTEVLELRRTNKREGINMDYLKNIILQYMTLPINSSERMSLIPVISTLLQFSPKDIESVQKSIKDPNWTSKQVKEVRRMVPVSSAGMMSMSANSFISNKTVQQNKIANSSNAANNTSNNSIAPAAVSSYSPPKLPQQVISNNNNSSMSSILNGVNNNSNNNGSSSNNNIIHSNSSSENNLNDAMIKHRQLSRSSQNSDMSQSDRDFHEKLKQMHATDVLNIKGSFDESEET